MSTRTDRIRDLLGKTRGAAAADAETGQSGVGLRPEDLALVAWSKNPSDLSSGTGNVAATGRQVFVRARLPGGLVTNIHTGVRVLGSGFTTGNLVGLFSSAGVQLGVSGDCSAADGTGWGSVGFKTHALTTPVIVPTGVYYIGFLMNATTLPTLNGHLPDSTGNMLAGMGSSGARAALTDTTTRTAFQSTYTLTGLAVTSQIPWWGIS